MVKHPGNSLTLSAPSSAPAAVVNAIKQASAKTGVDFAYLLENATTESGLNSSAKAGTSSAQGLYQFIESTWLETVDKHGAEHGLGKAADAISRDKSGKLVVSDPRIRREILAMRNNPQVAALMAAELAQDNKACLENALGREVNNTELYLAHFLGAGGATKLLSRMDINPDAKAAQLLPTAAQSNHNVFFEGGKAVTVDQLYDHFASRFGESSPAARDVAPATFAAVIEDERPEVAADTFTVPPSIPLPTEFREYAVPTTLPVQNLPQLAFNILQSLSFPGDDIRDANALRDDVTRLMG